MIDRNTAAAAIEGLAQAAAESVTQIAANLRTSSRSANNINLAIGGLMHAEGELAKVMELIRAAKALQQMTES